MLLFLGWKLLTVVTIYVHIFPSFSFFFGGGGGWKNGNGDALAMSLLSGGRLLQLSGKEWNFDGNAFTSWIITSLYGGPLEFLFIVESKYDPAYHVVSRLITEYKRTSLRAGPRGEQSPLFWGLSWLSFLSTHQLAIVVVSFEVIRTLKLEVIRTLKLGIR
ncbi:hypothetical protein ACJX0J_027126, partial [Zea mays]